MKKYREKISDAEISGLRRVGDLQFYGVPFLSLYYDIKNQFLYLSLSAYQRKDWSSWVFFTVRKEEVLRYMKNEMNLHDWMKKYELSECYMKQTYKVEKRTEWYLMEGIPQDLIPEDEYFDEDFCKEVHRIKDFLLNGKYEIKNNETPKELMYGIY